MKYQQTNQLEIDFIAEIQQNKNLIYRICYIYSDSSYGLNDLYQEVVINIWKAYPKFRGECKPSTWIYRIGLNTCISFYRKANSRPKVVPLTIDMDYVLSDSEKTGMLNEMYNLISKLSKMERALILLWLEDKSYKEIADIIGISVSNVAIRLTRIREKLKTMSNL